MIRSERELDRNDYFTVSSGHHLRLSPVLPRALSGSAQEVFFSGHWPKASLSADFLTTPFLELLPSEVCSPTHRERTDGVAGDKGCRSPLL